MFLERDIFGGQLVWDTGQDGHSQIFVVTYMLVDVKKKENMKSFLTLLHDDIRDYV